MKINNVRERLVSRFGKTFFNDVISMVMLLLIFIFFLVLIFILVFGLNQDVGLVTLSYNSIYKAIISVTWYKLYFLPISYLGIGVINALVSWAFFDRERLISYLLLFSTVIMGVFMIISEHNLIVF